MLHGHLERERDGWLVAYHRSGNRSTLGRTALFASHRKRVMSLVEARLPRSGEVCILGAGNSNDIDLPVLLGRCGQVQLVDIDREALESGVARWRQGGHSSLRLHGDLDITGVFASRAMRGASAVDLAAVAIHGVRLDLSPQDVVLSAGLLSQLLLTAFEIVDNDPDIGALLCSLISGHMLTVLRLLKPGGWGIVTIELVSSETLREIAPGCSPEVDLRTLASRAVATQNCFRNLDPESVLNCFLSTPDLRDTCDVVRLVEPWMWQMTPARNYLVYALEFQARK